MALQVNWNIGSQASSSASLLGSVLSFTSGSGYPSAISGRFSVDVYNPTSRTTTPASIIHCCQNNSIDILMPGGADSQMIQLKFYSAANSHSRNYFTYTTYTPTGVIAAPNNLTMIPGSYEIQVNMTNNVSATVQGIELISTINKTDKIVIANNSWTVTGSKDTAVIAFNVSLPTGQYSLMISTYPYGFVQLTDPIINSTFPSAFSTTGGSMSFNGGNFTITAENLSRSSYITVNNLRGDIANYTATKVIYHVPAFVTASTQAAFSLAKAAKIPNERLTLISDMGTTSNVSAVIDGRVNTHYGSNNSECWLGFDVGQGVELMVDRIRLFPSIEWSNVGKMILFSVVEGSNDMSNWNTLATIDQTIHSGWNFIKSSSGSTGYRYVRFRHNSTSQCNIG